MIFDALEGYSDPDGFTDDQGRRYDKVSMEDFPHVQKILGVLAGYALPDGQINPLGRSTAVKICEPLNQSRNVLLSGFGHAVLGAGKAADQSQVQVHFSGQTGSDGHGDCLSLVWYAHGRLNSGEIGGMNDAPGSWSSSTLSHNTVLIDRQQQAGGDTFGNVMLYVSDIDGLSVIQVDGAKAYRHLDAKTYRRTVIHNTVDPQRPYFIDVFEVEGGQIHDYSVHGSVFGDMEGKCSLDMRPMAGSRPMLDAAQSVVDPCGISGGLGMPSSAYGFLRNVDRARAEKDFNVTFAYTDGKGIGTRIHMFADSAMEIFLGETQGRLAGGGYSGVKVSERRMPHLIARRTGKKGLRSTFVAVYEMFDGNAKIKSVKRLSSLDAFVSLEIDLGRRVDRLFYCPVAKRSMMGGGVQMNGRLGLVTEKNSRFQGYLVAGTILRKSSMMVRKKKALYTGRVLTAMRKDAGDDSDAFTVDTILPSGYELSGKWMLVTYAAADAAGWKGLQSPAGPDEVTHAYQIDRVERQGVKMVVCLKDDHGLDIDGEKIKEVFSGYRDFGTAGRFVIYTSAKSLPRQGR